jgi:hypothetical protein
MEEQMYDATVEAAQEAESVLLSGHDVPLGRYTTVRRLLPQRQRRMVGAWCFVDHFGPEDVSRRPGMQVPPHPHTALQTVTWLVDGEIVHRDSLGSDQPIRPGQLNPHELRTWDLALGDVPAGAPGGHARAAVVGGAAGEGASRRSALRAPCRAPGPA